MFLAVSLLNHCLPEAWWFTLQGSPPWNTCAKSGGTVTHLNRKKKKKSDYKNKLINLQILKNKNTMTWLPVQPHKHICILGSIAVHEVQLAGEGRNRNTFKSTGAKHLVTSRDNLIQLSHSALLSAASPGGNGTAGWLCFCLVLFKDIFQKSFSE